MWDRLEYFSWVSHVSACVNCRGVLPDIFLIYSEILKFCTCFGILYRTPPPFWNISSQIIICILAIKSPEKSKHMPHY